MAYGLWTGGKKKKENKITKGILLPELLVITPKPIHP